MSELDKETKAAVAIRSDELCAGLQIDVMELCGYLRAAEIILSEHFDTAPSPHAIVQFSVAVAMNHKKDRH